MSLNEDGPIERPPKSSMRPYLIAALMLALACGGITVLIPEFRDDAKRLAFTMGDAVGIKLPGDDYSPEHQRIGIPRMSPRLLASSKISSSLEQFAREPCDKKAVFAFGEALLAEDEGRKAANTYLAFAANCPNGDGERFRAAQILFDIGDSGKVIAVTTGLIAGNPGIVNYRYLRGRALASVKRFAEAVDDYKSTIDLQINPRNTGEWVFVELANTYAAMGRHCDAAATIEGWAAIDPSARDTPQMRKKVEEYSARGCTNTPSSANIKKG